MSKYWSNLTKILEPYVPGEQPKDQKYIKLNTNENPYPPSPKVLSAINRAVDGDLRLYPDPTCDDLIRKLADYYHLSSSQVFVGNGSDEVLAFAFVGFFNPDKPIVFPDITYSFYKVYAKLYGILYELIPLDEQFHVPFEAIPDHHGGIVIPNPNAPTTIYAELDQIESLLQRYPDQVVIVDEAYIDFGGESAVKLINQYPNLLVVQTFSKSRSLAGLRVGMAFGNEQLIEGLNRIKNSFNSYTLDRLALAGAIAAIDDEEYFQKTRNKVMLTRERTAINLRELGFHVIESKANFVFITFPGIEAEYIFTELRKRGILVRYFAQPRIDQYLRVTIGTNEEMSYFEKAIQEIISKRG